MLNYRKNKTSHHKQLLKREDLFRGKLLCLAQTGKRVPQLYCYLQDTNRKTRLRPFLDDFQEPKKCGFKVEFSNTADQTTVLFHHLLKGSMILIYNHILECEVQSILGCPVFASLSLSLHLYIPDFDTDHIIQPNNSIYNKLLRPKTNIRVRSNGHVLS